MKDWKTTLAGLGTLFAVVCSQLNFVIPETWTAILLGIGVFLTAFLSKDKTAGGTQ
jgi:hypothetical protein